MSATVTLFFVPARLPPVFGLPLPAIGPIPPCKVYFALLQTFADSASVLGDREGRATLRCTWCVKKCVNS